jgi:hypothetical protein
LGVRGEVDGVDGEAGALDPATCPSTLAGIHVRMTDSDFDALRQELTLEHRGVWQKLTDRVRWLEKCRPWGIGIGVIGAFVGSLSRAVPDETASLVMAIAGGLVAVLSGMAVAAFDFRKLELTTSLGKAEDVAERAIAAGRSAVGNLDAARGEWRARDRRRVHRLTALASMREMIEQAMVNTLDTATAAEVAINVALFDIVGAIGFEPGEYWTLSVFEIDASEDMAFRIAAGWADRAGEEGDGRSWRAGEGYTGMAWRDGAEIIEADTATPAALRRYTVAPGKAKSYDPVRYRSVACVPIRIGSDQTIWGVVTATSDTIGRFKDEAPGSEVQAVDMVRDVAGMMALIAVAEGLTGDGADASE